jgi:hypothetical protein
MAGSVAKHCGLKNTKRRRKAPAACSNLGYWPACGKPALRYQPWRALKRGFTLLITYKRPRRRTTRLARWRLASDLSELRIFIGSVFHNQSRALKGLPRRGLVKIWREHSCADHACQLPRGASYRTILAPGGDRPHELSDHPRTGIDLGSTWRRARADRGQHLARNPAAHLAGRVDLADHAVSCLQGPSCSSSPRFTCSRCTASKSRRVKPAFCK